MIRHFLMAAATLALCAPVQAQSDYPNKPVKFIVELGAGQRH